jgi:predicted metal-dependent hydrolase
VYREAVTADFPPGFDGGVRHFNAGRFFEAHEAFEDLLDAVETDERWDLLVALIQVAVGYHKCASGHPGAARMLGLGLAKLAPFTDDARGLAVATLRDRIAADVARLAAGEDVAARLATDPPRLLPAARAGSRGC